MCGSKPKMPPAAAPAPPPIPEATTGATAPILGNDQAQLQRFDALRELSKLVIPGAIKPVAPSGALPVPPPAPVVPASRPGMGVGYGPGGGRGGAPTQQNKNTNNNQSSLYGVGINRRR